MRVIGIDPGLDGGVAVVGGEGNLVMDTPVLLTGKKREYDIVGMSKLISGMLLPGVLTVAAIERVHSMPKQGVASCFTFGKGFGLWLGILSALRIPYDLVDPRTWKKDMMNGMGKEKDAARLRAIQLFPELHGALKLKKNDGRAEALLIAERRRRQG